MLVKQYWNAVPGKLTTSLGKLVRRKGVKGAGVYNDAESSINLENELSTIAEQTIPPNAVFIQPATSEPSSPSDLSSALSVLDEKSLLNELVESDQQQLDEDVSSTTPVTSGQVPAVRDLWDEALQKLPKLTQEELKLKIEKKSLRQQIDEIIEETKSKQQQCQEKFASFRLGDHEIVLHDFTVKIIACLKQIGDIAIQFDPTQVSGPLSIVKLVMQIPVIESAQMCAMLACIDRIVHIIYRGQVYGSVYITENTPKDLLENLQSALVGLYSTSLELLANASKLFATNMAAQTAYSILHPEKVGDLGSKLTQLEQKLSYDVQACESERNGVVDARLERKLLGLYVPLTRLEENVCKMLNQMDHDSKMKLLEWISPIQYNTEYYIVNSAQKPGMCEWLLQNKKFLEWQDSSSSEILWLQGSPGAGKTFLTSKVIDHAKDLLDYSPNDEGFAFFYCSRSDPRRQHPLSVLQSYIHQLSAPATQSDVLREKLRDLRHKIIKDGSDLTFETCQEQLLESMSLYPRTTLILDALDECNTEFLDPFLGTINYLLSKTARPLKVFISSRPELKHHFLSWPTIEIDATDNQDDIDVVKLLIQKGADVNAFLRTEYYGSALAYAAYHGNKELVNLLLDNGVDINMILKEGLYGSALAAAVAGGKPSTVKLLVEKGADINMLLPGGNYGSALAAAAAKSESWSFNFLVERGADLNMLLTNEHYGSALIAAVCSKNISFVKSMLDQDGIDVNLLVQVGDYGSALAAAATYPGSIDIVRLLVEKGAEVDMLLNGGDFGSALAAAATGDYNNQLEIVEFLLQRGADINLHLEVGDYGSALIASIAEGDQGMPAFLVEKGADVNMVVEAGLYGSALASAAYWGDMDCVKLLLKAGAEVNLDLGEGCFRTALEAAWTELSLQDRLNHMLDNGVVERLRHEKAEVEQFLLDHGAIEHF